MEDITYQAFRTFRTLNHIIGWFWFVWLIAFLSLQREEIGIRKVLGASIRHCILFQRNFTWLVLIAFSLAAPLGYFAYEQLAANIFAHRIDLERNTFYILAS